MRTKVFLLVAVGFCMTLWSGAAVYAQDGGACAEDISKFCNDVKPGGGRIAKCLEEHENELSGMCKDEMVEVQKGFRETAEVCHDDVLKFCKDVEPGAGRIAKCLRDHQNELSNECQEQWLHLRKKR
jgi:Cysteine rich repeat